MDKINVNLTELSLDLVNFVGSADALQGVGGTIPPPPIGDPCLYHYGHLEVVISGQLDNKIIQYKKQMKLLMQMSFLLY